MKLQRSPNCWSCTITAFAMVLDADVRQLVDMVGHDGGEIFWPGLPDPQRRRGFHIQEMIDVADAFGYSVTPFEAKPLSGGPGKEPKAVTLKEPPVERLRRYMKDWVGVINGWTLKGIGHSVAWSGSVAFDTNATQLDLSTFTIQTFWRVVPKGRPHSPQRGATSE